MPGDDFHDGWLELLRSTTVYTPKCSCGWGGLPNDKGRGRRALAEHLTESGIDVISQTYRPRIEIDDWKRAGRPRP